MPEPDYYKQRGPDIGLVKFLSSVADGVVASLQLGAQTGSTITVSRPERE